MSSFLGGPPCTNLANCQCIECVGEREEAGVYEGKFSTAQPVATFADVTKQTMASGAADAGAAFSANKKEGFLLVRSDGKSSKKFKKAFKRFYVVVAKELLTIRKGQNSNQSLVEVNLANALLAFDRDKKNGEFIRIANAEDVLELKPMTDSIDAMNEWKDCLQGLRADDEPKHKSPTRGGMRSSMYMPKSPTAPSSGSFLTDGALAKSRGPDPSSPKRSPKKKASDDERRKFMEVMIQKEQNESLGMRICGGVGGDPHKPEIRIHSIQAGSVASGLNLEAGDIIVHINHRKLDDVTVQAASKLLQKAYGLVAMGVSRKVADQRPSVQLDTLPFADDGYASSPPPPTEVHETFGFPPDPPGAIAEDEEEGEHVEGFGGFEEAAPVAQEAAQEKPREQRFGDPEEEEKKEEAPAEKTSDEKAIRAERLRKMKEARAKKKGNIEGDLTEMLAWIDALDEDNC